MKIKLISISILLLFAVTQVHASPGYAYPQQDQYARQQSPGPGELLRVGVNKLLNFMRQSERPNPDLIMAYLDKEIAPYFDFAYMAKWAAGPRYRSLNVQQRDMLAERIKSMLLATLSQRLISYANQDVRFFQPRRTGQNEMRVRMGILQAGGYPTKVDFRFYRSESGWKVFDVSANGSSALTFYRQYFARQAGGSDGRRGYLR
jgi:phospholipid transport system substrate-binding protein